MARRHLVYVLPGIGGSVLERPGTAGQPGGVVWDAGFGDIADLLVRPGRLAPDEPLRPTGLIRSRRLLPGWTVVPGYERLLDGLRALPGVRLDEGHPDRRDPAANVVVLPYDFRLGVAHAAERLAADVHERLQDYAEAERAGRVTVVAHSMGGLVARYWLGPLEGWPLCRALITLGTPHRGAPKALNVLADGVRVAGVRLDRVSELLRSWPGVADLLPRYPAVWDATAGAARYPHELALPGLGAAAEAGRDLHQEIEAGWRSIPRGPDAPVVVPRLGWSHDTPSSAHWDGHRLTLRKTPPSWLRLDGWEHDHGDGTVPAFSAVPLELSADDASGWRERDRHGPLASAAWVPGLVEAYERRAPLTAVRGEERKASLGLDLDELHPAGAAVPLRVRLRGDTAPEGGEALSVWAAVRQAEEPGRRTAEVRLEWDPAEGCHRADLPGQRPGLYDVKVTVRAVPGVGDLTAGDAFAAVDA
ncbi:esterase/lipase family protein [Kitasatospora sp. NPDC056184]|uniref:esterase/lipase family protein n=1 Tax=Kitasatospora sp. NPDC056184 TaxID=3345738 RepID=UPI0035E3A264